jgi:putative heme iron utilization protein
LSYSQFTIDKVKQDFQLTTIEGVRFLPDSMEELNLSSRLQAILENLPWAIAVDTEKARSEVIINPILLALN